MLGANSTAATLSTAHPIFALPDLHSGRSSVFFCQPTPDNSLHATHSSNFPKTQGANKYTHNRLKKSLIAVEATDFASNAVAKETAADVTISCTGECSFEYYAESGDWYYGAIDDTQQYVVKLDYITNSADKSTGTFGLSDLDTNYSGLLDYTSGSKVVLTFKEGTTFTVNVEGSILTVTGTLVCSDGKTYKLVGKHDLSAGNQYDMSDQDVDVSFSSDEATVTTEDGYLIVDAVNSAKEYFSIVIKPNSNPNGVGTYEINSTFQAGTVQAGDIDGSTVYPTFYGTLTDDNQLNVPLFLCTAGTVEVAFDDAGNIKLNVNATNTWGRTAKIKVNWSAGVEDITADKAEGVRKVIENGRIVILKDGHKYNTLGIEVK